MTDPAPTAVPSSGPGPLAGVRVLAAEQMQALPYATQLLSRLGADVVKVEHPTQGESGRGDPRYGCRVRRPRHRAPLFPRVPT